MRGLPAVTTLADIGPGWSTHAACMSTAMGKSVSVTSSSISAERAEQRELVPLGAGQSVADYVRSIWSRRELAAEIASGELRAENQDTVLGAVWHLLNPLLLMGVYYLMFGVILGTSRGVDNFVAFLTIGIFSFRFTQKSIQSGAKSLIDNEGLIRSIQFPRAVLPLSTVVKEVFALGPAAVVMLGVALLTGEVPRLTWLLLVPLFAVQALFNLGGAMFMARVTDGFTDTKNILPFVFRLLFYMSGILYDVGRFTEDRPEYAWADQVFHANPIYVFVETARDCILHGVVDPVKWGIATAFAVGVAAIGFTFFRRGEGSYGRG